jgi:glutamate/aspartate transport system substrate-binding protein
MNRLRCKAVLAFLIVTIAGFSSAGHAQDAGGTLKKIADRNEITIGTRDSSIPFSYLDDNQQAIGYSIDICNRIVDVVKTELKLPNLKVTYTPITPSTRIPLMANGTIDLECGSTSNTIDRQKQVSFAPTTFVTTTRFVSKKGSGYKVYADLKGKTIVTTSGTTTIKLINEVNAKEGMNWNILPASDHAEAFAMVESGRATAFFMDDILLYSLVARSKNPGDYVISTEAMSVEPYGIILRKDDPSFQKLVNKAVTDLFQSGEINKLYDKWFQKPIPPKSLTLNLPMSAQLTKVVAAPTNSGDPDAYK